MGIKIINTAQTIAEENLKPMCKKFYKVQKNKNININSANKIEE